MSACSHTHPREYKNFGAPPQWDPEKILCAEGDLNPHAR